MQDWSKIETFDQVVEFYKKRLPGLPLNLYQSLAEGIARKREKELLEEEE